MYSLQWFPEIDTTNRDSSIEYLVSIIQYQIYSIDTPVSILKGDD